MGANKILNMKRQRLVCILTDWFTTALAFLSFNIFRFYYLNIGDDFEDLAVYILSPKLIGEQIIVPTALLFVYWISGYYNNPFERSRLNEFLNTFYSQIFNAVIIYLGMLTNDTLYLLRENMMLLLILFMLLFLFTYSGRLIITERLIKNRRLFKIRPRTVMIGTSDEAVKVASKLSNVQNNMPIDLVGFLPFGNEKDFSTIESEHPYAPVLNSIEDLKRLSELKNIDQVIIVPTPGKAPTKKILHYLYVLYPYDISIKINPDILSLITPTIRLDDILGEPFIDLSAPRISECSKNIKRSFDVLVSALGLIVLSPLFGLLSLAVKFSGPGKIIYTQQRVGIHRKPFNILKFRSMVSDAEKDGIPKLSGDRDSRITKVGKWMRKYRLDELPQLWNVFKGEMSLVGPRPEREYFIDKIVKKAPWYTLVLQVRPGITSWGMVKYGYATDVEQMIERNRFDLIYLANMSIAVDFKILIHTIKTVGSGAGK